MRRQRTYIQSPAVEAVLAQAQAVLRAPDTIFEALSYADMSFPSIQDDLGNPIVLSHGRYRLLLQHDRREVRRAAFEAYHQSYAALRNTFSATLAGAVRRNVFAARVRGYESTLHMALAPHQIPVAVYHMLIETVQRHLPLIHRYLGLRKRRLGLEQLCWYDLLVPLIPRSSTSVSYATAREQILAGLTPLGVDYGAVLRGGLYQERWVDVYETRHKRAGAYSWGAFDTKPFILLNWQGTLRSLLTLAHELGHSMHSYYTNNTQPAIYSEYPTFLGEVAATCSELLVSMHLLRTAENRALKLQVLDLLLQLMMETLVAQTPFAEFELEVYRRVEAGGAFTADHFDALYREVLERYGGPDIVIDDLAAKDWMTIPHFYLMFYVYQYATGITAALALTKQMLEEGQPAVERYRAFLSSGGSAPPIELLRRAGVDMTTPRPIEQALSVFAQWLDTFEALLAET